MTLGMCPLCPHRLSDHEDSEPCNAIPAENPPESQWTDGQPHPERVACVFTNRCRHRDRQEQPYPWFVYIDRALVSERVA